MRLAGLGAIAAAAFALRVFLSWEAVFGSEFVAFVESDAWYHMRLVDALVREFPNRIWHDPYLVHPAGEAVNAGPMLDWLVAGVALLLGGGAPSPRLVDLVGAFVPPVVGALTVVPVYVIGRELFSPRAGLLAAVLVAGMPGQLLVRSTLGFTDHHCLEALLTASTVMVFVLALRRDRPRNRRRGLAVLAGVSLGAYCLTWGGAILLMAVLALWAAAQVMVEWLGGGEPRDLIEALAIAIAVSALIVLPWTFTRPQFAHQLLAGGVILAALAAAGGVAVAVRRFRWPRVGTFVGAAAVAFAICGVAVLAAPELLTGLTADLARVSPFRRGAFVQEAQPLMASDLWRPIPLWTELAAAVALVPVGIALVARDVARRRDRGAMLLLVWSLVNLIATFGQIRFAQYFGLTAALLAGYACDRGLQALQARGARPIWLLTAAAAALLLVPGVPELEAKVLRQSPLASGWHDALLWMSTNTPPPFEARDVYFRPRPAGVDRSEYGVLAWWEHGYWITRIARRVPVTNPRQTNAAAAAAFMLATDEATANEVLRRLGARYVVASWESQARSPYSKANGYFGSFVLAAGGNVRDYCGLYVRDEATGPRDADLYCYPAYFQTAAIRLYLYGGRAAAPPGPVTVLASRRELRAGVPVNVITGEWSFPTYEAAAGFAAATARSDLRIVSRNLHETCVPLDEFGSYRAVFRSQVREGHETAPPTVQVFEHHVGEIEEQRGTR